ncbi:MAG: exodeoxyribonuclease VII small subunit [Paracoccaceae bacterium]
MTDAAIKVMTFEQAIGELESVVNQLEDPKVTLEDSIKLYERGEALKRHCETKLKSAEERVARIELDREGQPEGLKPLGDQ